MAVHSMSLARFREALSLAVNNTLEHPEMLEVVEPYGYTREVLEAVQADLAAFTEAKARKHAQYGLQKEATMELRKARKRFHEDVYMPHVTTARRVFKYDAPIQTKLGIRGRREQAFGRWINQVRQFYTNALESEDIKARLAVRNLTEEKLTAANDVAIAIEAKFHKRATTRGLAQQSTADRDAIRAELADWLSEYYEFARLAFVDNPEWLERIGLLHRSK